MLNELYIEHEVVFSCYTSLWRFPDCISQILGHDMILTIMLASLSLWASSFSFICICGTLWETWGKRRGRPCRVQYFHARFYLLQNYFSKLLLWPYSWTFHLSLAPLIFPLKVLHHWLLVILSVIHC